MVLTGGCQIEINFFPRQDEFVSRVRVGGHLNAVKWIALEPTMLPCEHRQLAGRKPSIEGCASESRSPVTATDQSYTVSTDSQGRFRFSDIEDGEYIVEAYSLGFEANTVEASAGTDVTIELALAGLHDGIVVTASRTETQTAGLALPTALVSDRQLSEQQGINLAQSLA